MKTKINTELNKVRLLADFRKKAEEILANEGIIRTVDNELEYEQEILSVYRRMSPSNPTKPRPNIIGDNPIGDISIVDSPR